MGDAKLRTDCWMKGEAGDGQAGVEQRREAEVDVAAGAGTRRRRDNRMEDDMTMLELRGNGTAIMWKRPLLQ